jgi:hypothetical protein
MRIVPTRCNQINRFGSTTGLRQHSITACSGWHMSPLLAKPLTLADWDTLITKRRYRSRSIRPQYLTPIMVTAGVFAILAKISRVWIPTMARFLVVLGLVILLLGLVWPYLARIGLGRLPGDFVVQRDHVTFYFPLMTCLLLSALFSLILWVVNR